MKRPYEALGVDRSATQEEIKKAYRRLSKKYHPDSGDGDEKRFQEINDAYEILGDEKHRKAFDETGQTPGELNHIIQRLNVLVRAYVVNCADSGQTLEEFIVFNCDQQIREYKTNLMQAVSALSSAKLQLSKQKPGTTLYDLVHAICVDQEKAKEAIQKAINEGPDKKIIDLSKEEDWFEGGTEAIAERAFENIKRKRDVRAARASHLGSDWGNRPDPNAFRW